MIAESQFVRILKLQAGKLGFELKQSSLDRLSLFTEILLLWNQKIHLVSKADATRARIARQIVNSLLPLSYYEIPQASRLLDLGSGAGFPALPMKIVRPDLNLVLSESSHKKTLHLESVIEQLRLGQVFLFDGRAEHLPPKYHNYFDYATAQASGKLDTIWTIVYPFLKTRARLIAYKGREVQKEIKRAEKSFGRLPGQIDVVFQINLPELDLGGYLVSVMKN